MTCSMNVSRREFLSTSGGLVLGFMIAPRVFAGGPQQEPWQQMPQGYFDPPPAKSPNAFIRIGQDNSVTFLIPRGEMGQGPTTACSQMLAEELECDWTTVRMEIAPVDPDLYGLQSTVGSLAVRTTWDPLRRVGAEAREMLIQAAAQRWNVSASGCRAEKGFVINTANGDRLSYGELADAASKLPVPEDVKLKDASEYTIIGQPLSRLDTRDKVTERAHYGLDARPAGLKHAVVARCPVFGGSVVSYDDAQARAVAGVRDVVQIPTGVAVIADNTWAALEGRRALRVEWDEAGNGAVSSATIKAFFAERAADGNGAVARNDGDANAALAQAAKRLDAVYDVPFYSHATMEPMNCTVHARSDGTAEAWVSTQSMTTARALVAAGLGIVPEKVTFHTLFCGGGFGRRGEGEQDFVFEAAQVAKHVDGPVKVTWSREDDMQHDMYRPAAYAQLSGAVDADGWPAVIKASLATPTLLRFSNGVDPTAVSGLSDVEYALPHFLAEWHMANTHVPVAFWRSPGAAHNTYFAECFLDELCAAGGKDPVEARRRLLTESPRLLHCLNVAAEQAGWGSALPAGRGRGVAVVKHVESYIAQVAEVSVTNGKIRVHKVVCAVDVGQVINPLILKQQVEGGVVYGLSATLKDAITIDRGRVEQANFNTFDMIRIDEAPEVEVHVIASTERPGGAGELANPCTVPAVMNAVFDATGKRIRSLPVRAADLA